MAFDASGFRTFRVTDPAATFKVLATVGVPSVTEAPVTVNIIMLVDAIRVLFNVNDAVVFEARVDAITIEPAATLRVTAVVLLVNWVTLLTPSNLK